MPEPKYTGHDAADRARFIKTLNAGLPRDGSTSINASREWSDWVAGASPPRRPGLFRTVWLAIRMVLLPGLDIVSTNRGKLPGDAIFGAITHAIAFVIVSLLPVLAIVAAGGLSALLLLVLWLLLQILILVAFSVYWLIWTRKRITMKREYPRSRCRACAYPLAGLPPAYDEAEQAGASACPECGEPWPALA